MREEITVNEALKKGRIKLIYLPISIIVGFIGLGLLFKENQSIGEWILLLNLIAGILLAWLTWSYFVNDWKIWAYENVRNIHELQRKAVEEKLIWESGSWFEKTEFKSQEQKIKLKALEKKFLEKDVHKDNLSVPKETLIFYSKTALVFLLIIRLGMISIGIYFLWEENYFVSFLIAIGLYLTYEQIKKLRDNEPQISINDKGIKLKNKKLVSWENIHNDKVFTKTNGKNSTNYLAFNNEMVDIGELTVKFEELENLLHVYRVRNEIITKSQ